MSIGKRISFLKVLGRTLSTIADILLIFWGFFVTIFPIFQNLSQSPEVVRGWLSAWFVTRWIPETIVYLVIFYVLKQVAGLALGKAKELRGGVESELMGFVQGYGRISVSELSRKVRLTEAETESWLAKLLAEDRFRYGIDSQSREVFPLEKGGEGKYIAEVLRKPLRTRKSVEASKLEKSLAMLEEFHKSGKIDDATYEKLKKEYEKKIGEARASTEEA